MKIEFIGNEKAEVYHMYRQQFVTSSELMDFKASPLKYKWIKDGRIESKESAAMKLGTAFHLMLLEGEDVFKRHYIVGGPVNPATGATYGTETKKFREWVEENAQGRDVISHEDLDRVKEMVKGVWGHADARRLLISCTMREAVLRGIEMEGLQCQCRLDGFDPVNGVLMDVKTTADIEMFEVRARHFHYANQMAFYKAMIQKAGHKITSILLLVVETDAPYRCGVWSIDLRKLAMYEQENTALLAQLKDCIEEDVFPTGYETVRTLAI